MKTRYRLPLRTRGTPPTSTKMWTSKPRLEHHEDPLSKDRAHHLHIMSKNSSQPLNAS